MPFIAIAIMIAAVLGGGYSFAALDSARVGNDVAADTSVRADASVHAQAGADADANASTTGVVTADYTGFRAKSSAMFGLFF